MKAALADVLKEMHYSVENLVASWVIYLLAKTPFFSTMGYIGQLWHVKIKMKVINMLLDQQNY